MINYFKNSSANNFKNSNINNWKQTSFVSKTKSTILITEPYNSGVIATIIIVEPYVLISDILKIVNEIYGLKLGITFEEYYDDVLTPIAFIEEYYNDTVIPIININFPYNDAVTPINFLTEKYDSIHSPILNLVEPYDDISVITKEIQELYNDYSEVRTTIDEPYKIFSNIISIVNEIYAITGTTIQKSIEIPYGIFNYEKVMTQIDLPYPLLSGDSYLITPTASMTVEGQNIDFIALDINAGMDSYCITGTVALASEADYINCAYLNSVVCIINGENYSFFIEIKEKQESNEGTAYSLSLLSPTAKLDAPYAKTIVDPLPNGIYAKTLVEQMAAIEGITVDYQILDWFLPSFAISINDETPLTVIKKVVNSVGAIVQSKPNGELLIISEYPISPKDWNAIIPSTILDKAKDLLSIKEVNEINTGFNAFIISDQGSSSDNIFLKEENIDETTKIIKGFRIPFNDGEFDLETSGGIQVTIDKYQYPIEETIPVVKKQEDEEWEYIEFIDWVGNTSYPIYGIVDYDWIEEDLGAFQISENGTLTIINQNAVPSESLLKIKYITKYWKWTVTGPVDKKVQFFIPEET